MADLTPIGDELLEDYRCQNRDGPDGQRCQLLSDHEETELPRPPYRWAPSFPREES